MGKRYLQGFIPPVSFPQGLSWASCLSSRSHLPKISLPVLSKLTSPLSHRTQDGGRTPLLLALGYCAVPYSFPTSDPWLWQESLLKLSSIYSIWKCQVLFRFFFSFPAKTLDWTTQIKVNTLFLIVLQTSLKYWHQKWYLINLKCYV